MKVKDFLKIKGRSVVTIGPDETIHTAIQKLVENTIGALPCVMPRARWWESFPKETS